MRKSNKYSTANLRCLYFSLVRLQIEETPYIFLVMQTVMLNDFTLNVSFQHFFQVNTVKVPVIIDSCVTDSELV